MKQATLRKTSNKLGIGNKKEVLFYSLFIAIPVIHFLVFYVYINFNSILLAFQTHNLVDGGPPHLFPEFLILFDIFSEIISIMKRYTNSK